MPNSIQVTVVLQPGNPTSLQYALNGQPNPQPIQADDPASAWEQLTAAISKQVGADWDPDQDEPQPGNQPAQEPGNEPEQAGPIPTADEMWHSEANMRMKKRQSVEDMS